MRLAHRLVAPSLALCALALPLAACGGGSGGGGEGGDLDKTATLPLFVDNRTGTMDNAPQSWNAAGGGGTVSLGDDFALGTDLEMRGFLTFDLAPLPAGAAITTAIVRLSGRVSGGNPYAVHGLPLVDHMDVGTEMTLNDYDDTFTTGIALFPTFTNAILYQPGEFDVTGALRTDFENGQTDTSFRVYFAGAPEMNSLDDFVAIQVSTTDVTLRPVVVVTYR